VRRRRAEFYRDEPRRCRIFCGSAESQPNFYTLLASRIFIGANMAQTKMIAIKL